MSKKKKVIVPGIAQRGLWGVFKSYLTRKKEETGKRNYSYADFWDDDDYDAEMQRLRMYYGYDCYDEDDDWYVDEDGAIIYPPKKKETAKVIDINTPYSGFEEDPDELDDFGTHKIYFYLDFRERNDVEIFNSLKEFDKYCKEEGLHVPEDVAENISYWSESHCCLYPVTSVLHKPMEIMAADSYDNLWYEGTYIEENERCELW